MENTLQGVDGKGSLGGLSSFEKSADESFAHPAAGAGGFGGSEGNPYATGHSSTTTSGSHGASNLTGSQGQSTESSLLGGQGQSSAHRVAEGKEEFGYGGQPSAGRDFGSGREAGGNLNQGPAQVLSSYKDGQSTGHNTSSAGGLASGAGGLHSGSTGSQNPLSSGNNTGADYQVGNTRHGVSEISGGTTRTHEHGGLSGMQPQDLGGKTFAGNTGHTFGQVTDTDRSKSSENWERQAGVDLAGGSGTLGSEHSAHKDSNRGATGTATDKSYTGHESHGHHHNKEGHHHGKEGDHHHAKEGAAGVGAAGLAGAAAHHHASSNNPGLTNSGTSGYSGDNTGAGLHSGSNVIGQSSPLGQGQSSGLHQSSTTGTGLHSGNDSSNYGKAGAAGLGAAGLGGAAAYGAGHHDSSNTGTGTNQSSTGNTQSGGFQGLDNQIPQTGNPQADKAMNAANDKLKERTDDDGFTNLAQEGQQPVAGLTGRAKLDANDPKVETTLKSRSNKDAQGRELDSYGKPYDL